MNGSGENGGEDARRDRYGLLAFSTYLALSFSIFGVPLWGHFGDYHSATADPSLFMWYLVWWPHALAARLNPFVTNLLWAPIGINLAWMTCVPFPSIAASPLTRLFGPIASLNIISMLAPPLAGWSAFILCRHVSRSWWPSLLGGYLFGFSSSMLTEEFNSDLHVTLVFLIPLAAYVVVRALEGNLTRGKLAVLLAAILIGQFLTAVEGFAMLTMLGTMALVLGWIFAPRDIVGRLAIIVAPLLIGLTITLVVVSPYLYFLFGIASPRGEIWSVDTFSVDLLGLLFPSRVNSLGLFPPFGSLTNYFVPVLAIRNPAYVGLPLFAVVAAYAWDGWRSPTGKTLIVSLLAVLVLSLGPRLHIGGNMIFTMPSKVLFSLPLIQKMLPYRFMTYAFLIIAIITALWFASNRMNYRINVALAAVVILSTLPNFSYPWFHPANAPEFFTTAEYREYIKPDDNVLIFPFSWRGDSMLWHAQTEMGFHLVGGWPGALHPMEFENWPFFWALLQPTYLPDATRQFGAFLAHHYVDSIAIADGDPNGKYWGNLASNFAETKRQAGGVTIYRLKATALKPYLELSAEQLQQQSRASVIDSLVFAASQWLSTGHSFAQFDPAKAVESKALNDSWCAGVRIDPTSGRENEVMETIHHWYCGIEIGGGYHGNVIVGAPGTYADFEPTIERYRKFATHIYFPYGIDLLRPGVPAPPDGERAFLEMEFTPQRIAAIAPQLRIPSAP